MLDHKKFYKKSAKQRISFTHKFRKVYSIISDEINNILENSSNLLFLSAGHSSMVDMLKYNNIYVLEIIEEFHSLYTNQHVKKITKLENLKKIKNVDIDDVIISNLEYSNDPIKLMNDVNKTLGDNGKVSIICNNVFWNPIFKIFELIGLKFKHPRKNLITSNFVENLCFLSDFELVKKKRIILLPFNIPILTTFINNIVSKIPIINLFCLVSLYILRAKPKRSLKLDNITVSIIVPCKNEENNVKLVVDSLEKIGKKTEVLFGNDNSNDNTESEIKKFIPKRKDIDIVYYEGPGICKAKNVYKGFEIAKGDVLVIHDADNTVDPIELKKIVKVLVEKNQNLVIGTRLIYPMEKKAMKFSNYLGNLFFSYFYSLILQQNVTDTLCGTKAIFRKDWSKIRNYIGGWGIEDKWGDFELLSGAKINLMRISEVPVNYKERVQGETKMTNTIFNGLRMLIICVVSFIKIRIK
tara:strand:+ start:615 stop:2018 length:1404 start_codon:yes stop_codon:yes gene_type:complete